MIVLCILFCGIAASVTLAIAFVYLAWWQALIASGITALAGLIFVVLAVRWAIRVVARQAMRAFEVKSRVLRGARLEVHDIQPLPLALPGSPQRWYELEVSVIPDPQQQGPIPHWNSRDLVFVPADVPPPTTTLRKRRRVVPVPEIRPNRIRLCAPNSLDGQIAGPGRLRIVAGFPPNVREVSLRYFYEQFGRISLVPHASAEPSEPPLEPATPVAG